MLPCLFRPGKSIVSVGQPGGGMDGDELFTAWLELPEYQKVRRLIDIERGKSWEPIGIL